MSLRPHIEKVVSHRLFPVSVLAVCFFLMYCALAIELGNRRVFFAAVSLVAFFRVSMAKPLAGDEERRASHQIIDEMVAEYTEQRKLPWSQTIHKHDFLLVAGSFVVAALEAHLVVQYSWWRPSLSLAVALCAIGLGIIGMTNNTNESKYFMVFGKTDYAERPIGMYSFIRHPGYLGCLLFRLGFAFCFGMILPFQLYLVHLGLLMMKMEEEECLLGTCALYEPLKTHTKYRILPWIY